MDIHVEADAFECGEKRRAVFDWVGKEGQENLAVFAKKVRVAKGPQAVVETDVAIKRVSWAIVSKSVRRAVSEFEQVKKQVGGNQGELAGEWGEAWSPSMKKPTIGSGEGESGQGGEGAVSDLAQGMEAREGSGKFGADARGGKA